MADLTFPTNIKQIGSIGDGMRIYIEDYACSYLQQYAEAGGYEERFAFLVGRYIVIDGQTALFISGVVQGKHMIIDKDVTLFSDKSWRHAKNEISRYFNSLDIVGGVHSQPGYGTCLNAAYADAFKKAFIREDQVLFVIDPVEKLNAFYLYDEKQENLLESQGYFIYYDKNRGMHEYMLDNKLTKMSVRPLAETDEASIPKTDEETGEKIGDPRVKTSRRRLSAAPSYAKSALAASVSASKNMTTGQKRIVNLLVSLSSVLFIISFIMGAGLIQNDGRIAAMENQLTQLNTAYRDLLMQLRPGDTANVFADSAPPGDSDGEQSREKNGEPPETASSASETSPPKPGAPESDLSGANLSGTDLSETNLSGADLSGSDLSETTPSDLLSSDAPPISSDASLTSSAYIPDTYVVQDGDTLSYISRRFYGDTGKVDAIMTLNGLDNPDMIYFGKVLALPK